jgi:hypothetical protein
MNPNNYGTREACQRLVDAGIVLETEHYWYRSASGKKHDYPFVLRYGKGGVDYCGTFREENIPAPSMAEVWRELPFQTYIKKLEDGYFMVWILGDSVETDIFNSPTILRANPTDALIDLLIWKAQKEGKDGQE